MVLLARNLAVVTIMISTISETNSQPSREIRVGPLDKLYNFLYNQLGKLVEGTTAHTANPRRQ
jgi:hypothetical protein